MAPSVQVDAAGKRQCPFCGVPISVHASQCPFCREAIPPVPEHRRSPAGSSRAIRRGLLWMLLAAVIQYFAGGYSGLRLPISIPQPVTAYLVPLLFVAGLALSLYGVLLRMRA